MTYPQITERPGSLSYNGFSKETTFGTPVAASTFLPMTGNTMEEDPGWFAPHLMQNLRDLQVYNLQGEAKFTGAVTGPIFPSNAIELLVASIGADAIVGWGVAATAATPTSTTSTLSTTAGATSITLTSGTGFAVGQQIVVDTGYNQEFRLISNVATNVITVADAFNYAHNSGVTVTTGTTTTLSAPSLAAATTITVTSATGIVTGSIIQIDVNSVAGTTTSEIRKVTNVVTTTVTLDTALVYAHATNAQVTLVSAPYTHFINEQNTLPSLTVEKAIGGFQSLQFAGCRVGKFDLKMPTGNNAAEVSVDITGQSVTTLGTPTPISIANELPFVFAEANLSIFGNARTETSNVSVTVDNGLKETYTYSGQHGPSFITPVTLHTSGAIDLVWSSLTDTTYGDFTKMANQTLGSMQFSLVHPGTNGMISFFMPQVVYSKFANDLKMEDVVMSTLTYEASRQLTGSTQYTLQAAVANDVYIAY